MNGRTTLGIWGMFKILVLLASTNTAKPNAMSSPDSTLNKTNLNALTLSGAPILIQMISAGS